MKRVFALAFVYILFISAIVPVTAQTKDSVRNKKVVSIVYDDSGSMTGDKWVHANYAMQAFISMLNKEDELYITYMTDPKNSTKINIDNLSVAVDNIRNHSDSGNTPIDSLKTGFDTLKNVNDNNSNTQYWLVAFTDGGFNEADNIEVCKMLDGYASTDMTNGTKPHIFFMTINDTKSTFTPSTNNKNVDIRSAENEDDISTNIFSVASEVSGRYSVDSKDISFIDEKTISVNADIPLLNMGILTQNTNVKVDSIISDEGFKVPIKSNVSLSAPDESNPCTLGASDNALEMYGNMTLAGKENENIPAGKYKITFSDKIDIDDFVIMFEPALALRIALYKDGKEISDVSKITEDEKGVSAKAGLYEFGTDNAILPSLLPNGITYSMVHTKDDKEIESSDTLEIDSLAINSGLNNVTASVNLPGYFNLSNSIEFTPSSFTCSSIDAEICGDGSERLKNKNGKPDGEDVVYLTRMDKNKTGVKFTLYEDGKPIDKSRALSVEDEFRKGIEADFPFYEVEIQNDGGFLVYPTKTSFLYNSLIEFMFHHDKQNIKVTLGGASADENLIFKLGEGYFYDVPKIILPIYFIWWLIFKKHLPRGTLTYYSGRVDWNSFDNDPCYREEDYIRLNWFGAFKNPLFILPKLLVLLLPFASRIRFCGYTFIGQKNLIHRSNTQLIVKNVKKKAVSTTNRYPSRESTEAKTELDNKLYIKESEVSFSRFDFE